MKCPLNKPAYKVNLIRQHCICESNYHKLLKLLPDLDQQDEYTLLVSHSVHQGQMHFHVQNRARYTTTLRITFEADWSQWFALPTMQVRLYHDASMAEVTSVQKIRYVEPVYTYPNDKMLLPDEKEQLNLFLSDWLNFCFSGGHVHYGIV